MRGSGCCPVILGTTVRFSACTPGRACPIRVDDCESGNTRRRRRPLQDSPVWAHTLRDGRKPSLFSTRRQTCPLCEQRSDCRADRALVAGQPHPKSRLAPHVARLLPTPGSLEAPRDMSAPPPHHQQRHRPLAKAPAARGRLATSRLWIGEGTGRTRSAAHGEWRRRHRASRTQSSASRAAAVE